MGWRAYVDKQRRAVFFWSQKSACTTLHHFLMDNIEPRPESRQYFLGRQASFEVARRFIRQEGYQSVILVRHPVTRAISAYCNKLLFFNGRMLRTRDDLEPLTVPLFDEWRRLSGITDARNGMSFEGFLATVDRLHRRRKNRRERLDGHWDSQIPKHVFNFRFRYDHVLRVENLQQDLAHVAEAFGMRFRPRRMNATPQTAAAVRYLGDVPAWRIAKEDILYENFISPETLGTIHRIYHADFRKFDYPLVPDLPGLSDAARTALKDRTRLSPRLPFIL